MHTYFAWIGAPAVEKNWDKVRYFKREQFHSSWFEKPLKYHFLRALLFNSTERVENWAHFSRRRGSIVWHKNWKLRQIEVWPCVFQWQYCHLTRILPTQRKIIINKQKIRYFWIDKKRAISKFSDSLSLGLISLIKFKLCPLYYLNHGCE